MADPIEGCWLEASGRRTPPLLDALGYGFEMMLRSYEGTELAATSVKEDHRLQTRREDSITPCLTLSAVFGL